MKGNYCMEKKDYIYTNTKLNHCLRCNTPVEQDWDNFAYCMKCGAPIINTCTDLNCINSRKMLPVDAAFCPICGNETVFYQYGLVKSNYNDNSEDLPF